MEERNETWTKGPWEIAPGAEPSVFARVEIGGKSARMFVCSLETTEVDEWPEQRDANARLIAAAPALYTAAVPFDALAKLYELSDEARQWGDDSPVEISVKLGDLRALHAALLLANTGGTENG